MPSVGLLIIAALLLQTETTLYGEILANETTEWSMPVISDFINAQVNQDLNATDVGARIL